MTAVALVLTAATVLTACGGTGGTGTASNRKVTAWQLSSVSGDGHDLAISFVAGGGCYDDPHVDHAESATAVTITSTTRKTANTQVCTSDLVVGHTTVHLQQPLGTRSLVHPIVQFGPQSIGTDHVP